MPQFTLVKKLPIEGFNASLLTLVDNTYLGTIRKQILTKTIPGHPRYPEVINETTLFTLDSEFNLIGEPNPLEDLPGRQKHTSYTTGLEDCRLLSDSELLAVTLDTNNRWKPEMSYVKFENNKITSIQPLSIECFPLSIEKNWIPIQRWDSEIHIWHFSNPFRFLRLNLQTGKGSVIKEYPGLSGTIHNASIVKLPGSDNFLGSVRVKEGYKYKHSLFLLFDSEYNLLSISEPFRFFEEYEKDISYEMCMNMFIKNEQLFCVVSVNDKYSAVLKTPLTSVFNL